MTLRELPEKPGISAIVNRANGHRYVGQATIIQQRVRTHVRALNAGMHFPLSSRRWLQDAWTEFGSQSFDFQVLEIVENNKGLHPYHERADNLSLAEQFYIDQQSEAVPLS